MHTYIFIGYAHIYTHYILVLTHIHTHAESYQNHGKWLLLHKALWMEDSYDVFSFVTLVKPKILYLFLTLFLLLRLFYLVAPF